MGLRDLSYGAANLTVDMHAWTSVGGQVRSHAGHPREI